MENSSWFIILIALSVLIFVYTIYKTREPYIFATFFVMSGLAFVLEYFVLIIGDGYEYHPNFISHPFYDSLLGSLVSQAVSIPIAAITIAAFRWNIYIICAITLLFVGIEEMFIRLAIYEQYWWKTIYTGILLPFYFLFAKLWLNLLQQMRNKIVHFTTLYFYGLSINSIILFFLVLIFNTHELKVGWFNDASRDHIAANTIYIIILTAVFSILIFKKVRGSIIVAVLAVYILIDYLLIWTGVLTLAKWWHVPYFTILNVIDLVMLYFVNQYILYKYFRYL